MSEKSAPNLSKVGRIVEKRWLLNAVGMILTEVWLKTTAVGCAAKGLPVMCCLSPVREDGHIESG